MAKHSPHPAPFPTDEQILEFIKESPGRVGKREIARAFNLDADQKLQLKKVLKRLKDEGTLSSNRGRLADPGALPPVTVVDVHTTDIDGELMARPVTWDDKLPMPVIYMMPVRRGQGALGVGDRVLARMERVDETDDGRPVYEGRTIRRLDHAPQDVLGVYKLDRAGHGRVKSTDRKVKSDFMVADNGHLEPQEGDLVRAEVLPGKKLGLRQVKLHEKIARTGPKSISLIAIYDHSIPVEFPDDALKQARLAGAPPMKGRVDLRDVPLITIDGEDARDFDDAVFAEPDDNPANDGGWHIIVAIADVSWYVRPGDALDVEAYKRGNSVYFPDRVVPMLPEELSNGWCSLKPHEERTTLAAHLWIDADGEMIRHRFERAMIKSKARTTYTQIQRARDGDPDELTAPLVDDVIAPLYGAYEALSKSRKRRGVLELDLPERKIIIGEDGNVAGVEPRERFDSHKLIEEFMILANVAAAETLEKAHQPAMYRIHDEPSREKIAALGEFLQSVSIPFNKGQVVQAKEFNRILDAAKGNADSHLISEVVLRSQAQAEYNPDNIGHFGLALQRYCHFTSPIRRYADLLVHRALVKGLKLGQGGLEDDHKSFTEMGEHLSVTERNAAHAERDAVDRFTALYLSERVGQVMDGRINGVTRFGLFVTLNDTGADGLVPIRSLGDDFFIHDEARHALTGRDTRLEFRMGDPVKVLVVEADPLTGSTVFQITEGGQTVKHAPKPPKGKGRGPNRGGKPKAASKGTGKGKPKGKSRAARRAKRKE